MDYSIFGSVMTVVMLAVFLGIVAWAFSGKRSAAFEEAARVPLEDEVERGERGTSRAAAEEKR